MPSSPPAPFQGIDHAPLICSSESFPCCCCSRRGEAAAHAMLDHAEPRVGNKVATAPREVTLWFTQKLEPAFSTITVTDAAGQRVDTGKTRVSGNQMSVSLRSGGSRNLPRDVARAVGGHPYDGWQFHLSGRPVGAGLPMDWFGAGDDGPLIVGSRGPFRRDSDHGRRPGFPGGGGGARFAIGAKRSPRSLRSTNAAPGMDRPRDRAGIRRDLVFACRPSSMSGLPFARGHDLAGAVDGIEQDAIRRWCRKSASRWRWFWRPVWPVTGFRWRDWLALGGRPRPDCCHRLDRPCRLDARCEWETCIWPPMRCISLPRRLDRRAWCRWSFCSPQPGAITLSLGVAGPGRDRAVFDARHRQRGDAAGNRYRQRMDPGRLVSRAGDHAIRPAADAQDGCFRCHVGVRCGQPVLVDAAACRCFGG